MYIKMRNSPRPGYRANRSIPSTRTSPNSPSNRHVALTRLRTARKTSYKRLMPTPSSADSRNWTVCSASGSCIVSENRREKKLPVVCASFSYWMESTRPSTLTCPPSKESICRCSPSPRMMIVPRLVFRTTEASSKLSTSLTPLTESFFRLSKTSLWGSSNVGSWDPVIAMVPRPFRKIKARGHTSSGLYIRCTGWDL